MIRVEVDMTGDDSSHDHKQIATTIADVLGEGACGYFRSSVVVTVVTSLLGDEMAPRVSKLYPEEPK
ncbi:MAG: hypothetical protein CEN90_676 [Parcubacteria group bacterium Licking1014_17]|nr:MAG: hypothetical protein CEN90_676 [Parcubacteria group bacterium Licking1014_17]